jgi:hypothetical protein
MNILQIGSNTGRDHVFGYIYHNQSIIDNVYLVDANKQCIELSQEQYKDIKNVTFVNYAIVGNDDEFVDFYIPENHEHGSTDEMHVRYHDHIEYRKERLPAKNINKLFEDLNLKVIDRLYIDTEGLDADIVNNIDFSKVEIKYLMFEYIHSDGTRTYGGPKLDLCKSKLESMGYKLSIDDYNMIAEK